MHSKHFIRTLHHERIVHAIGEAEKLTSGEIRVFIAKKHIDDPVRSAQSEFERLGMTRTQQRNGVLLYIAPVSQSFAIIGDQGIHEKCGQTFWCEVAEAMRGKFIEGQYTDGVIHGIQTAGQVLKQHFPRQKKDINELPDEIVEG